MLGQNCSFQHVLVPHDPDRAVVDLDHVNQRSQVGLAEGNGPGRELLSHIPAESLQQRRVNQDRGTPARFCPFERRFGGVPLGFQSVQPIFQDIVNLGDAVFDELIETLELVLGLADDTLQFEDSIVRGIGLFSTSGG